MDNLFARALPGPYRLARSIYSSLLKDRRKAFTEYYEKNLWGDADSRSGGGSNLAATARLRDALPGLLDRLGVKSMIDAPCGDFFWMKEVDLGDVSYHGFDIVDEMVARNREAFGGPSVQFDTADLVTDTLPRADLIMSRDALIHFSNRDAKRALRRFKDSGATFLALSHQPWVQENIDITTGGHRPVNLRKPPFGFPEPIETVFDGSMENEAREQRGELSDPKYLAVWRVVDLPI